MKPIFRQPIPAAVADIRPLGDFVIVQRLEFEAPSAVIVAPKSRKEDRPGMRKGLVLSVGPGDLPTSVKQARTLADRGEERFAMNVQPGDTVLYARAPANTISLGGVEYDLLHEEQHILAVIEEKSA